MDGEKSLHLTDEPTGARDFELEKERLKAVLEHLKEYYSEIVGQKSVIDGDLEAALKKYDPDNLDQYTEVMIKTALQEALTSKTKASARSLKKPYFSRVDFTEGGEKSVSSYYIGKMSVLRDGDKVPLVIDWRAPAATLYYEGRMGSASYECPDGLINGEISLKRQYMIEDGVLNDFFDIDITANDEFLQAALGSSKDKRLKDIVSTIQAEQNRIIRADMHRPVIVQGAAGGGKTTIALHRIAYLLYNYEKRLSPGNVMIIAPNRFFLSYISEVLPDLGVENVLQTTFEDFVCGFIEKKLKVRPPEEKFAYLLKNPQSFNAITRISKIKSSLTYKKIVDRFIGLVAEGILPPKDYTLGSYTLIEREKIRKLFNDDYSYLPISKRIDEIKKYFTNSLKKRKPEILEEINNRYDAELDRIKLRMPEDSDERRAIITELLDKRDAELNLIKKKSQGLAPDYFKQVKFKRAHEYYKDLISDENTFNLCCHGLLKENDMQNVRKLSLRELAGDFYAIEDLAPIMYIHYAFYGPEGADIRHIVIDEAQDTSLFQAAALKQLMRSNSFTILGDLCQGIYSYRGITDWESVSEKIFDGNSRMMTLEQSYRTTVEIMDFANIAVRKLNLENVAEAKPVIRHGSEVLVHIKSSYEEISAAVNETASGFLAEGYKSVAVICKTVEECLSLKACFAEGSMMAEATVVTGKESDFGGGTVIIPSYLSKGLEFDAVIIADADAASYSLNETDIKLLYVAMTRALHELVIFAKDNISEILRGSL